MTGRGNARSPLFRRVFLLMLTCVAVVQLMNFVLLLAVQGPSAKVYSVGQVVDALGGRGTAPGLSRSVVAAVRPVPWNPRNERMALAFAKALGMPVDRVQIRFPTALFQRDRGYRRDEAPRPVAPSSVEDARNILMIGDFELALRQPDGRWLELRSSHAWEPWRWYAIWWLVVAAVAVAPFAWALAHRLAKPLGAFAQAAERLGRDPRAPPIAVAATPEIAEAAESFNQMQARLNRYVDDRTTVIGALAHDLRTPLMRLGLRLEHAPDTLRGTCEADIREMQAMISATMSYLRDTSAPGTRRPLDLRSLVETVIDDLTDRGADAVLEPGPPVVIDGSSVALKAMLNNLVGNAVKYGGGAAVTLARRDNQAIVEVRDNGPGMPPADLDRAFEPFFRAERSRNRDTGGIGLGLPSARAVARAHGGEVTLENRAAGGLRATVTLPA